MHSYVDHLVYYTHRWQNAVVVHYFFVYHCDSHVSKRTMFMFMLAFIFVLSCKIDIHCTLLLLFSLLMSYKLQLQLQQIPHTQFVHRGVVCVLWACGFAHLEGQRLPNRVSSMPLLLPRCGGLPHRCELPDYVHGYRVCVIRAVHCDAVREDVLPPSNRWYLLLTRRRSCRCWCHVLHRHSEPRLSPLPTLWCMDPRGRLVLWSRPLHVLSGQVFRSESRCAS